MSDALEKLARALGYRSADAIMNTGGANGCVGEIAEHGHRAIIKVNANCVFEVRLFRCGQEDKGPVRVQANIDSIEAAHETALKMCEESQAGQLDLFA